MSSIFTRNLKSKFTEEFINDVASANSNYYICFGKVDSWDDDQNPPLANGSVFASFYDVQKNILYGKKVSVSDIAYMAKNIQYVPGTIYDYYDDKDPDLYNKNFYVINQYGRVYKCLFNNYGAPSTTVPNITSTIGDFTTADGYIWKYLFYVPTTFQKKFSTDEYFAANTDPSVQFHSEPGAIHVIVVDSSANGYIQTSGYVQEYISPTLVRIDTGALPVNGAYTNSAFYVVYGTGAGSILKISNYVANEQGNFVYTTDNIPQLDTTSFYSIVPYVTINGDGNGCAAIPVVNNFTSYIDSIQVINRGSNFSYADISVEANSVFVTGNTVLHAIISPPGGHGSNVVKELGCDTTGMSVFVANTDGFPSWVTYRQLSLLYNPISASNNSIFNDSGFKNYYTMNVTINNLPFQPFETITGFLSGATGIVLYCDDGQMFVYNVQGTFAAFELVTGTYSGYTALISTIIPPQLTINTGEIFYYRNIEPITRDPFSSEQIKLFFKV